MKRFLILEIICIVCCFSVSASEQHKVIISSIPEEIFEKQARALHLNGECAEKGRTYFEQRQATARKILSDNTIASEVVAAELELLTNEAAQYMEKLLYISCFGVVVTFDAIASFLAETYDTKVWEKDKGFCRGIFHRNVSEKLEKLDSEKKFLESDLDRLASQLTFVHSERLATAILKILDQSKNKKSDKKPV